MYIDSAVFTRPAVAEEEEDEFGQVASDSVMIWSGRCDVQEHDAETNKRLSGDADYHAFADVFFSGALPSVLRIDDEGLIIQGEHERRGRVITLDRLSDALTIRIY